MSRTRSTGRSSPATCCSPARSAAPISRAATGRRCSHRSRTLVDAYPGRDRRPPGPRPGDDARRGARPQPVPRRAAARAPGARRVTDRPKLERPRGTHDVVPAEMPRWERVTGEIERLCGALRLPPNPDAGVRGHRALRAHLGRGLGRRAEGDVHVHRSLRPVADAASRGDRADLPRVRRARHAPRPAAGEAVHDRADVPVRRPRARAATASTGRRRSRRSARTTRRSTPR